MQSKNYSTPPLEYFKEIFEILHLLKKHTNYDFSSYKPHFIYNRIYAHMCNLQLNSFNMYINFIKQFPNEIEVLFNQLLITTTYFFRDQKAFELLKTHLLSYFKLKKEPHFRVWVPGCSSGEEVYSIAIILEECLQEIKRDLNLQIIGTDIHSNSLEKAISGKYKTTHIKTINPERVSNFFIKKHDFYQVHPDIYKNITFEKRNILEGSPLHDLDLICCRNLLIYMNSSLKNTVLNILRINLKSKGIIFLGSAEKIEMEGWNIISKQCNLYQKM